MESFKAYLPSNACPTLFTDNTSTDYRIRFEKPIDLDGQWEVGVESIYYSSHINDEKESSQVYFHLKTVKDVAVNDLYPYEFLIKKNGLWKGFDGIYPTEFEKDSSKLESVIATLNTVNRSMLSAQSLVKHDHLFHFTLTEDGRVQYRCSDTNFVLQLTNHLARVLGFGYLTVLSTRDAITGTYKPKASEKALIKDDYWIRYMHKSCQEKQKRIVINSYGEKFDGKEDSFLELWKKKVSSVVDIRAEFKKGKLVLHNHRPDIGITFSSYFSTIFAMSEPFFGGGSRWASSQAKLKDSLEVERLFIDIYTLKMDITHQVNFHNFSLTLYPWRCKTMKAVLHLMNSQTQSLLQGKLKEMYNEKKHRFEISFEPLSNICKVSLGSWIQCYFDKNLSYLLGFPDKELRESENRAVRKVDSLSNHSRQLHLVSSLIQPTAYGKHQRQILCDFLHKRNVETITEKRFDPISYHTVARNFIDMIDIQLTDDLFDPISIQDSTTIVTLYFRKVK